MARAKRHYIPGHVWHLTHRCHKREFLLKFPRDRRRWADSEIRPDIGEKEDKWTQSIAVGSQSFVKKMKKALGHRATGRKVIGADDTYELREVQAPYGVVRDSDSGNALLWA